MSKILVADDDRLVLFTLCEGLRQAGLEVVEARDGLEALALCHSEKPELALLDVRMPGLEGLELGQRLKSETTVPFIFFSGNEDKDYIDRAVEIGAFGYLVKPLFIDAVLPIIRKALARSPCEISDRAMNDRIQKALVPGSEPD